MRVLATLLVCGLLASGSAFGNALRDKIQKELDTNSVLQREQVKIRVLGVKEGSVTLEMTDGPKMLRDLLRQGLDADGAGFPLTNLPKGSLNALMGLRKSLRTIKRLGAVKEVSITGALNSVMDQAEELYDEAIQQLGKEQYILDDPRAREKAVGLLRRSAEMGYLHAQSDLGAAYAFGVGVRQDSEQAVYWFRKAAEGGDPPAQFNLGKMYTAGQGMEKNYKEALQWYEKAAQQERAPDVRHKALNLLALILATCPEESLRNGPSAVENAQKAIALSPPSNIAPIETLAAAYARCGRFADAVEQEKKFSQLMVDLKEIDPAEKEKLLNQAKSRLELYQKNQAYTEGVAR